MKWTAAGNISSPVGSIWGKTGEGEGMRRMLIIVGLLNQREVSSTVKGVTYPPNTTRSDTNSIPPCIYEGERYSIECM